MATAFSTARRDSWEVCVVYPSEVEQSSVSTEFDSIVKRPGSLETSGLCHGVAGRESGLPRPLRIAHSLTEFSRPKLLLLTVVHPVSDCPVPTITFRPFLPFSGFSCPCPAPTSMSPTVVPTSRGRSAGTGIVLTADP